MIIRSKNSRQKVRNSSRCNEILCPFCQSTIFQPLYNTISTAGDNFTLNKCQICKCIYISPNPTNKQLQNAYDVAYYGQHSSKFPGWIEKVLDHFRFQRARKVMRYIKPPANILDIGCGNGRFLQGLIENNYNCYGVELPSKSAERALMIKKLNLKIGRLCEKDYDYNYFDVVTMWHVFEHLSEPRETLRIVKKILKRNGYLMISMPNIGSFQSKLFRGKWLHLDPPRHLFFFEPSDLIKIMNDSGFELIMINHLSLEQNPFGFQQSILNCFFRKREILFEFLKGNRGYAYDCSEFSIWIQKLFLVVTFPVVILLSLIESGFKMGGTVEMIFQKN